MQTKVQEYKVDVVYCGGDPALFIMNKEGEEVEEHPLEAFSENEIAELLESKGFGKHVLME